MKNMFETRRPLLGFCLALLLFIQILMPAAAWAENAKEPVLPDPGAFFHNDVSFDVTDWKLIVGEGICASASFHYADLAHVQEYVQCVKDHYAFTLTEEIKDEMSKYVPSLRSYNLGYLFAFSGGGNLSTLHHYYGYDNHEGNICIDLLVDPDNDQVTLSIYYGVDISFRDDGYRCSVDGITGKDVDTGDYTDDHDHPSPKPSSSPTRCARCHGTGKITCGVCGGSGKVRRYVSGGGYNGIGSGHYEDRPCSSCNGYGEKTCYTCGGDGRLD